MDNNKYLKSLILKLNIAFALFAGATIYEFFYMLTTGSTLSIVLFVISFASMLTVLTLKSFFEDFQKRK